MDKNIGNEQVRRSIAEVYYREYTRRIESNRLYLMDDTYKSIYEIDKITDINDVYAHVRKLLKRIAEGES